MTRGAWLLSRSGGIWRIEIRNLGSMGVGYAFILRGSEGMVGKFLKLMGIEAAITVRQEHGNKILMATKVVPDRAPGVLTFGEGDGIITVERRRALVIKVGDCLALSLFVPGIAVANIHVGWRGLSEGIVEKGIRKISRYGTWYAILSPSICGKCYEVKGDVASRMVGRGSIWRVRSGSVFLDIKGTVKNILRRYIPYERIFDVNICTFENNDILYSHRRGDVGRNLSLIWLM